MSGATCKLDPKNATGRGRYVSFDLKFDFVLSRNGNEPEFAEGQGSKPTFHVNIIDRDGEVIEEGGAAWRYVDQRGQPRLRVTFTERSFQRYLRGKSSFSITLWGQKEGDKYGGAAGTTYKGRDEDEEAPRAREAA